MIVPVNYLAVVVAAVVAFVVGWVWYGPLFGKAWMKSRGMEPMSMSGMKMPIPQMVAEFVATLVTAFVIAQFEAWLGGGISIGWMNGVILGLWVWVGFYATAMLGSVLWEKHNWTYYCINTGVRLVNIVLMAVIIAAWH